MPGGTTPDGRLEVHVAARIPAEAIGAGAGMISEYANTDLMGAYAGLGDDLSLGLEGLRVGDIVALADADHRYGRGYQAGYLTIGVMSTGQCMLFGHGPGPSTLLSGPVRGLPRWWTTRTRTWPAGSTRNLRTTAVTPRPPGSSRCTGDGAAGVRPALRPVAVNLLGVVEHPVLDGGPWRIGRNGTPYVPLGDGGIVLGLELG